MITDTFIKHHWSTHMNKNAAGQDNKAGGLEFPMYALTAAAFLSISCSQHSYREVGRGPGEHFD